MIARRAFLGAGVLTAAGAAAGLAGCGNAAARTSSSPDALVVGLSYIPNVQFAAFYLGLERGIFADHGLEVSLRHHGQQEDLFGAVLADQEQIVFASADEAMVAAAGGQALQTFATSYQRYPAEVMGRERLDLPAVPLQVLKGASLGIPGHYGSSYFAALAAIHQAGLSDADVTLTDIGYTQLSALAADRVDFIVGFSNNELVQLRSSGEPVTSIPVTDPDSPELVGPSLIVKSGRLDETRLAAMAAALADAEKAVAADPEAAIEATVGQVPALADVGQRAVAADVLGATIELWQRDGQISTEVDVKAMEAMGNFLLSVGIIDQIPEDPYLVVG